MNTSKLVSITRADGGLHAALDDGSVFVYRVYGSFWEAVAPVPGTEAARREAKAEAATSTDRQEQPVYG